MSRLQNNTLYYFQDFERMVTFNLADELKKGERVNRHSGVVPEERRRGRIRRAPAG